MFQISGAGIANNSAHTQSIFISGDVSLDQAGELVFLNNATAGSNVLITNGPTFLDGGSGGVTSFEDNSTAGGATIVNRSDGISTGSQTPLGGVTNFRDNATAAGATITNATGHSDTMTRFDDNSTAGSADITNEGAANPPSFHILDGRGLTLFVGSSDAGAAEITNMGATGPEAAVGATGFRDNASAGDATIINQGGVNDGLGGETIFSDNATAGTAMITTSGGSFGNPGGRTVFTESSTAANAQLITNGGFLGVGGRTSFTGNASGGEAVVTTNGGGMFDISGLATNGTTVGSIAGLGSYVLGAKRLTVGTGFRRPVCQHGSFRPDLRDRRFADEDRQWSADTFRRQHVHRRHDPRRRPAQRRQRRRAGPGDATDFRRHPRQPCRGYRHSQQHHRLRRFRRVASAGLLRATRAGR